MNEDASIFLLRRRKKDRYFSPFGVIFVEAFEDMLAGMLKQDSSKEMENYNIRLSIDDVIQKII